LSWIERETAGVGSGFFTWGWVVPADCGIFDVVMSPVSAPAVGLFVSSVSAFFAIWVLMRVLGRFSG
jgi:hypothetical protein